MTEPERRPSRTGWTRTIAKCVMAMAASMAAATGLLYVVLERLLGRLPGWLPAAWVRWAFEWIVSHLWFVGPVVGLFVGAIVSSAIVVVDARAGAPLEASVTVLGRTRNELTPAGRARVRRPFAV